MLVLRRVLKWHFVSDGTSGVRVSSQAFKPDDGEVSVNVCCRPDVYLDAAMDNLLAGFSRSGFGAITVPVTTIVDLNLRLVAAPLPDNPWHANILDVDRAAMRRLAAAASIEHHP
jgi:hypothetical protein